MPAAEIIILTPPFAETGDAVVDVGVGVNSLAMPREEGGGR